jgi:iron complex outermembrane receptor protein
LAQAETVSKGIFPAAGTYLQNDRASTGRVGLNYLFDNGISPYANYSTSFVPTSGTDQFGHVFKPTTGEGAEIGVKFKPLGSNLMLAAAFFDTTQQNVLTADPTNIAFSVQTGEARVRGFEFEARGNVTRELEIVGATANAIGHKKSNATAVGKSDRRSCAQTFAMGQIRIVAGPVGLASAAACAMSASFAIAPIRFNPDYTLFDATIGFDLNTAPRLKGWSARINATNQRTVRQSLCDRFPYCSLGAAQWFSEPSIRSRIGTGFGVQDCRCENGWSTNGPASSGSSMLLCIAGLPLITMRRSITGRSPSRCGGGGAGTPLCGSRSRGCSAPSRLRTS